MKIRKHHNKKVVNNNYIAPNHNRNKTDINGLISIGSGLTVNPSATNLVNVTSNDYRAFLRQDASSKQYHVLSNENTASSGAIIPANVKTPTRLERANNTMQNFYASNPNTFGAGQQPRSSIKCLEVLSKQVAQSRANKSRKVLRSSSNVNKTYDIRSATAQNCDTQNYEKNRENEKYYQKMDEVRREKRNKYEQAVFKY